VLAAVSGSTGLFGADPSPKTHHARSGFSENPRFSSANSFFFLLQTTSMHSHVLALERTADPANKQTYRATSVTISGSGF